MHWLLTRAASLKVAEVEHAAEAATRPCTDVYNVADVSRLHVLTLHNTLQLIALIGLGH